MNKLRSDVLFNRALIWLALSFTAWGFSEKPASNVFLVACLYNVFASYRAWGEDE